MAVPGASTNPTHVSVPYSGKLKNGLMIIVRCSHVDTQTYGTILITNYSARDNSFSTVIGVTPGTISVSDVKYQSGTFTFLVKNCSSEEMFKVAFLQLDLDGTSSGGN